MLLFYLPGSPYHPLIVDPVNVRVSGGWRPYLDEKGLIPLKVNKEKHLPFDVSQAGPGEKRGEHIYLGTTPVLVWYTMTRCSTVLRRKTLP